MGDASILFREVERRRWHILVDRFEFWASSWIYICRKCFLSLLWLFFFWLMYFKGRYSSCELCHFLSTDSKSLLDIFLHSPHRRHRKRQSIEHELFFWKVYKECGMCVNITIIYSSTTHSKIESIYTFSRVSKEFFYEVKFLLVIGYLDDIFILKNKVSSFMSRFKIRK